MPLLAALNAPRPLVSLRRPARGETSQLSKIPVWILVDFVQEWPLVWHKHPLRRARGSPIRAAGSVSAISVITTRTLHPPQDLMAVDSAGPSPAASRTAGRATGRVLVQITPHPGSVNQSAVGPRTDLPVADPAEVGPRTGPPVADPAEAGPRADLLVVVLGHRSP